MPTRSISLMEDALKLKALRAQIRAGIGALKRGEFVEVEETGLDDHLGGLTDARERRD